MSDKDEEDKLRSAAAAVTSVALEAFKLMPQVLTVPIQARMIGLMVAGHAFMTKQTIDEAWPGLRKFAIAEQVYYETTVKPELDARNKGQQ
jgi:hypothetical protein